MINGPQHCPCHHHHQHEISGQNVPVLGWEVCQLGVSGECLDYENVRWLFTPRQQHNYNLHEPWHDADYEFAHCYESQDISYCDQWTGENWVDTQLFFVDIICIQSSSPLLDSGIEETVMFDRYVRCRYHTKCTLEHGTTSVPVAQIAARWHGDSFTKWHSRARLLLAARGCTMGIIFRVVAD